MRDVIIDCLVRVEGSASWVVVGWVEVGIVSSNGVLASYIIIGHQVPEIEILIHPSEMLFVVIGGA